MVRRRALAATIGLALLGMLIVAAFSLKVGTPSAASLATSGEAAAGYDALVRAGIAPGVLTPFEVLVEGGDPSAVAAVMADVDGIIGAVAPTGPEWQRDETLLVVALPAAEGSAAASSETLDRARDAAHDQAGRVLIGGSAAAEADFSDAVYGNAPVMIGLIVAVTYVLLVRAFRSLLLPLKAVVVNVLSVGAAYGVLVLVWQEGFGSELLWGIEATQAISTWLPLMVFSFLFGLSMDYEVFILARMREEYDATGSTDAAVIRGLSYTGRLVTAAALILFLAFVSLAAIPQTEVKIMATGLAAGILIDATIVRALLVPAAVSLMGRWNWWLPTWLDRFVPRSAQKTERSATAVSSPAD